MKNLSHFSSNPSKRFIFFGIETFDPTKFEENESLNKKPEEEKVNVFKEDREKATKEKAGILVNKPEVEVEKDIGRGGGEIAGTNNEEEKNIDQSGDLIDAETDSDGSLTAEILSGENKAIGGVGEGTQKNANENFSSV